MNNNAIRASSNLRMLELAARKLEKLKDDFVFLGGCTTALFITDPLTPDIRSTADVDCIIDVISLPKFYLIGEELKKLGFKNSAAIYRWRYDDLILDIMPTDEKILGFSNRWYAAAIQHYITQKITDDLFIKTVTAPYFLATKLEAFKGRGNEDYLGSHDLEDILTVIDGRAEIISEINSAEITLKQYLAETFNTLLQNSQFITALPGHLNYGSITTDRVKIILDRIKEIAN